MAEKKATPKPESGVDAKSDAGAPGGAEEKKAPGRKKINKMTPAEIDARLNELRSAQGGLRSKHARQLFLRKKILSK
jgi:hypothetical protein